MTQEEAQWLRPPGSVTKDSHSDLFQGAGTSGQPQALSAVTWAKPWQVAGVAEARHGGMVWGAGDNAERWQEMKLLH